MQQGLQSDPSHQIAAGCTARQPTAMHLPHGTRMTACGNGFQAEDGHISCLRIREARKYVLGNSPGQMMVICLRGSVSVNSVDGNFVLEGRRFVSLPTTSITSVVAERRGDYVLCHISEATLIRLGTLRFFRSIAEPILLPVTVRPTRDMMRCLIEFLRAGDAGRHSTDEPDFRLLVAAVQAQSRTAGEWVRRAHGRSERHRRGAVVRLLSAYNRIVNAPFKEHDLATLAAASSYSPSHFLRSFRSVFGKTPHVLLMESRMAMARNLILGGGMSINEVALSVGYESRQAFSRSFKRDSGFTASRFRAGEIIAAKAR